jgi:HPt (histidine-containing phosphotransfer) domain-containing protein
MFDKLLEKWRLATGRAVAETKQVSTPDISRVIPIRAPDPDSEKPTIASSVDPEELADKAEAAVDSLSGQFEAWMSADLDNLIAAWNAANAPEATREDYRAVFMAAHNIRGIAGSYGYPAISRLCGSLATLLSETHPGENAALINLHVKACRAAFIGVGKGDGSDSVAEAVCDALEQSVASKAGAT